NGIVLLEHYKELKKEGMAHTDDLIINGAKDRLRAVLLTASAAALGFLPMAVSTGAGAEVQRPLATVVIGGLVTATLLTLIVLPVLYSIFMDGKKRKPSSFGSKRKGLGLLFLLIGIPMAGQEISSESPGKQLAQEELIELALKNN